jgi:two-component system cell cycle sensor histidine kinase/response regulator CckA
MLAPSLVPGRFQRSDDLVGAIVHDFNNQLTAISGFTEFLEQDMPAGDPRREDIAEIRRVARRAADVSRQFALFLVQQPGATRIFNVDEVMYALEKMLRRILREDLFLRMDLDAPDIMVNSDPVNLNRIVVDLALDVSRTLTTGSALFIETRPVSVAEGEWASAAPGDYVVVSVSDGDSVPEDCRVYLPVAASEKVLETRKTGGETVLLVEDETALRAVAKRALDRNGYMVLEATNGADALVVAEEFDGRIDLLLTDIVMPIMGGYALARALSTVRPGLRVLFVSGYAPDIIGPPRLEGGHSVYLEKPFSTRQLTETVRALLDDTKL